MKVLSSENLKGQNADEEGVPVSLSSWLCLGALKRWREFREVGVNGKEKKHPEDRNGREMEKSDFEEKRAAQL